MNNKVLVAASSRPVVLSILSRGENCGYAIIQEVRSLSNGQLQWSDGMLYPVLHRLEREGLIESSWRSRETNRRRKYYRLSRRGNRALEAERNRWLTAHNTLAQLWEKSHVRFERDDV